MAQAGYLRSEEEGFEAIVILDESTGDSLEFQRSLDSTADGSLDGSMGTYCLVRAAGPAIYGGVESWSVGVGELVLRLTAEASGVLELPTETHVQLDPGAVEVIVERLPQILR